MSGKNTFRSSRNLPFTLAITFFILSMVVLLVSSGLQIFSNARTQQDAIANQQELTAREAGKTVNKFIEDNFRALESMAKLVNLPKGSVEQKKLILESVLYTQPSFRQMALLNAAGKEITQVSRVSLTLSEQFTAQLQDEILAQTQQGQRYLSQIYIDDVTGEPVIVMAAPIDVWDFQGILAAEVNLQFMWNLVNQLKVGETGYAYVVDKQGNLIAFRDTNRVLRENVALVEKVSEFVNNDSQAEYETLTSLSQGINETTVFTTYSVLGTPDWAVVIELPWQEAYKNVIAQGIQSILITLSMALLAGLIGVFAARRLAVPLTNLTETATKITQGNIELEATVEGPNEVVHLANAFNSMTAQLRGFIGSLEQRVAERTTELEQANQQVKRRAEQFEAIAQISRIIGSIQNQEELLARITRTISQYFGFYHVGIFLLDDNNQYAVLRAANSEGGKRMLKRGHRLEVGQTGIVGFVTSTGNPRIALDTGTDAVYFDNPDLPDTHSEMALPLKVGGQVVGALDVQSVEPNAFSREDINILSTLADQVSAALENVRLHEEAQEALSKAEAAYRQLTSDTWSNIQRISPVAGYRFDGQKAEPLNKPANGTQPESQKEAFSVPMRLRGESIGRLRIKPATEGHQWSDDEIAIIQATAERVALAVENARLVFESQKRASKEQVIGEISTKISSAINLDNILQTTLREMGRILPGAEISIQVENE
jgi:GAF domain-containing protein/HAMP domain-containing protein